MAPLVLAGLSLLPKIPEMWGAVAGLFGKNVPKSITEATKLATNVLDSFTKNEIPPAIQLSLEKEVNRHKEKIQEFALEEVKLTYQNVHDMVELEKESYKTDDEYVRRTRPMILRKLFISCVGYSFYAPLVIIALSQGGIAEGTIIVLIDMVKYIGGWLFGTFSASYLGYAASRSVDKRNPGFKEGNGIMNKITKGFLKLK